MEKQKVFTLVVLSDMVEDGIALLSTFTSEEAADKALYKYVKENWRDVADDDETIPDDNYEAIKMYFAKTTCETYSITLNYIES